MFVSVSVSLYAVAWPWPDTSTSQEHKESKCVLRVNSNELWARDTDLKASEDAVGVDAVLRAAAVDPGCAGVTLVASCMAVCD